VRKSNLIIPRAPTVADQARRLAIALGSLVAAQFLLNGLDNVLGGWHMFSLWVMGGGVATLMTIRTEMYMAKRRRRPF
jgi:hypothetical protein